MNELKQLTWTDFDKFNPCYSPQDKYGDFSGTILDILNDERIPDDDKLWAATREGILDDRTLRLFACKCVREVWHLLTDERSRNAVEVAERYAKGQSTDDELKSARAAAVAAARDAWAAWAAWSAWAAVAAASDAAWSAAWAAGAAADAASDAAGAAAGVKQVQFLIETIHETR